MQVKEILLTVLLQVLIEKLASGLMLKLSQRDRLCKLLTRCSHMLANIKTRTNDAQEKQLADKTVKQWHLRLIEYLTTEANDLLDHMASDTLTERSEAAKEKKRKEKQSQNTNSAEKVKVSLNAHSLSKTHHATNIKLRSEYLAVSKTITECLNEMEMDVMVTKTQFGNLIKCAEDNSLSSKLMSFLISNLVYVSSCKEVWIVVHGRPLRFSKLEYALITGLDCSNDYPKIVRSTRFSDKHFNGSRRVSIKQVETKLREMKEQTMDKVVNLEKLKIACLYFVSSVLRPVKLRNSVSVDCGVMSLVDDFASFNDYPWGKVAFVELMRNLKGIFTEKYTDVYHQQESDKWLDKSSFCIRGFIHPMQIFAYECIPGVASMHATLKHGSHISLPGMCRWKSSHWHEKATDQKYIEIEPDSDKTTGGRVDFLTSTDEEITASYITKDHLIGSSSDTLMPPTATLISKWKTACSKKLPRRLFTRVPVPRHVAHGTKEKFHSSCDRKGKKPYMELPFDPGLHGTKEKFHSLCDRKGKKPYMELSFDPGSSKAMASAASEEITDLRSYIDRKFLVFEKKLHEAVNARDTSLVRTHEKLDPELPHAKRRRKLNNKVAKSSQDLFAHDPPSAPSVDAMTLAPDVDAPIYNPTLFSCSFLL